MADRRPIAWDGAEGRRLMDRLRTLGDPHVDELMAGVDRRLGGRGGDLWAATARQVEGEPTCPDRGLARYLAEPAWPGDVADGDRLAVAEAFFADNRWAVSVGFLLGSLPMSYCGVSGATALVRTGRLHGEQAQRRIFETALLVMEIAEPGGLTDGGPGYLTLRRLRVLHAAVRRTLLEHRYDARQDDGRGEPWDTAQLGMPVSQLELLGTLWVFAFGPLDALDKAGHCVGGEVEDAWVHLWSVAGILLGVGQVDADDVPPLLPMGRVEARACYDAIREEQFGPSPEGRLLAGHLRAVGHARVPWRRYDGLVEALMRDHLGPQRAAWLGLPAATPDDDRLLARARRIWGLSQGRSLLDRIGHWRVHQWLLWRTSRWLARRGADRQSLRTPSVHDDLLEHHLGWIGAWASRRRKLARRLRDGLSRRSGVDRSR